MQSNLNQRPSAPSQFRRNAVRRSILRDHGIRAGCGTRDASRRRPEGRQSFTLEISGYAKDLPYKIEWSEFPAAAPILEALNAGALDVGYTGDLSFLTVYAAGAPIKAIGGTRSDARTQAILVGKDSPIKTAEDLKGKRLAGTRGGWGQFLIDATLEKAGFKIDEATFAPLGRSMPRSRWSRARSTHGRCGSPTCPTRR